MLRDLLADEIERQEGLEVVGRVLDPVDLLVAVAECEADVVVATWPDSNTPGIVTHLLIEFPDLCVLGLPRNADHAVAARRTITQTTIERAGLEELLSAVRLERGERLAKTT